MSVLSQQPDHFVDSVPLKERLKAMLEVMLEDARLDPLLKNIIPKLVNNFLKNASDKELLEVLQKLRDEIVPFLLNDEPCNCMTYDIRGSHHKPDCPRYENPDRQ